MTVCAPETILVPLSTVRPCESVRCMLYDGTYESDGRDRSIWQHLQTVVN